MMLTCEAVERQLDLFLYGELSFTEEEQLQRHLESCAHCRARLVETQAWHRAVAAVESPVPSGLLVSARRGMRERLASASAVRPAFGSAWLEWIVGASGFGRLGWRPVATLLLAVAAFAAGRLTVDSGGAGVADTLAGPATTRVRYVESVADGSVQIALDETRQRMVSGTLEDPRIRALLIAAAKDPSDPGLRVDSVEVLCSRSEESEVRDALIHALEHDTNAGVRLKAIEGLKAYGRDPRTRAALTRVLLSDTNPGVRAQAIDALTQVRAQDIVAPLQELLRKEDNSYVRLRTQRVLEEMNASPGIF